MWFVFLNPKQIKEKLSSRCNANVYSANRAVFSNAVWCNMDTSPVMNPGSEGVEGLRSSDTITTPWSTQPGWVICPHSLPIRVLRHRSPLLIHSCFLSCIDDCVRFGGFLVPCSPVIPRWSMQRLSSGQTLWLIEVGKWIVYSLHWTWKRKRGAAGDWMRQEEFKRWLADIEK